MCIGSQWETFTEFFPSDSDRNDDGGHAIRMYAKSTVRPSKSFCTNTRYECALLDQRIIVVVDENVEIAQNMIS